MLHAEFVKKWEGKSTDIDGQYGDQCIDLIKQYQQDVYELPIPWFGGSAWKAWLNTYNTFPPELYVRVINERWAIPPQGAIVCFEKWFSGGYGHIAINHEADSENCTVLEQNAGKGTGSGLGSDAIRLHEYKGYNQIVGWYIPKILLEQMRPRSLGEKTLDVMNRKLGTNLWPNDPVPFWAFAKNEYQNNAKFRKLVDNEK